MTLDEAYAAIQEFDKTFPVPYDPGHRLRLLIEELGEWCEAANKDKSKEYQAEELVDVLYVLLGTFDVAGYDLYAALEKVVEKNKKKVIRKDHLKVSSTGKILKEEDSF